MDLEVITEANSILQMEQTGSNAFNKELEGIDVTRLNLLVVTKST